MHRIGGPLHGGMTGAIAIAGARERARWRVFVLACAITCSTSLSHRRGAIRPAPTSSTLSRRRPWVSPRCPDVAPPLLSEQEMRVQAHGRAERGTSCCLAGTCECGGAYRRDPEINARVVAAIAADPRLRDSSVWVTTMRKFVTLQGCMRSARQRQWLERLVKAQPDVAIVWNETRVGAAAPARRFSEKAAAAIVPRCTRAGRPPARAIHCALVARSPARKSPRPTGAAARRASGG